MRLEPVVDDMKVGDLVKTIYAAPNSLHYSGILVEITEPKGAQQTQRAIVLTTTGELRTERMSYNLLEKVKEI